MSVRFYLGMSWSSLRQWAATQVQLAELGSPPATFEGAAGHAVTDALRAALPGLDDEELEHYAATEAAQDSLLFLDYDDDDPDRRLVLAVDLDAVEPSDDARPSAVRSTGIAVPRDVVAFLVDEAEAGPIMRAASSALYLGADNADELVERCLDHDLRWYAGSELDVVLSLP